MKLKDLLITENGIFQNNYVRVNMVEDALQKLFPNDEIAIEFDENGLFIILDDFQFREYETQGLTGFKLTLSGLFDEIKNTKKYYIELIGI